MFATLHTTAGDIRIELLPNHAPKTVANFVGLAQGTKAWSDPRTGAERTEPFYDGLIFHRVISDFMIQGGCPLGTGTGGPGYTFNDEIHPELQFDKPYLLAMANAGVRRNPVTGDVEGTNGSQFFISTVPTPWLNGKHTIFGTVADDASRAVVDGINNTPTRPGDRPQEDIVITSVTIED
ncbi:peptidylprolyl isomerase [Cellulosimicrobium sp. Marseille-Q8652]